MTTELTKPVSRLVKRVNQVVTIADEGIYLRVPRKRKRIGPLTYQAILKALGAAPDEPTLTAEP